MTNDQKDNVTLFKQWGLPLDEISELGEVLWDLMGLTAHMGVKLGNACTRSGLATDGETGCQLA